MLKINLSDPRKPSGGEGVQKQTVPEPPAGAEPVQAPSPQPSPEKPAPRKTRRPTFTPALAAVIVIVILAIGAYLGRDLFLSFFPETVEQPPPVTVTPSQPEPVVVETEPDPVFSLLNALSETIPPRVWLSNVMLRYDGSYVMQGMAFAHEVMAVLDSGLVEIGVVTERFYPRKSESSESIYRFTVSGRVEGFTTPEILDIIPSERLTRYAAPAIAGSADAGVTFALTPEPGKTYGESDLPFVLTGPFVGLKQVIGTLCGDDSDVRVYQLVIVPSEVVRPYDRVKASFALRTKSSI